MALAAEPVVAVRGPAMTAALAFNQILMGTHHVQRGRGKAAIRSSLGCARGVAVSPKATSLELLVVRIVGLTAEATTPLSVFARSELMRALVEF